MPDLDDLRAVLRERERLAPDPGRIAVAARARGTRTRRVRAVGAVAGTAAALAVLVALATSVLGSPTAGPPAGGTGATPTAPRDGDWPATPRYPRSTGSAAAVPGPTQLPTAPASGRAIDPVVPFSVTLPGGWREASWWYEEGSFRGTWAREGSTVAFAVVEVLDPATKPESLLRPSGDPATGTPGPDGTLAWRADPRHFVRILLQGEPAPDVFESITGTLRFAPRAMIAPFAVDHVPAGLHLSGALVTFGTDVTRGGMREQTPWTVRLTFDAADSASGGHDLELTVVAALDAGSPVAPAPDPTTLAGYPATVQTLPGGGTVAQAYGVRGTNPYLVLGERVPATEAARVIEGLRFAPRPADTSTWLPLRLP